MTALAAGLLIHLLGGFAALFAGSGRSSRAARIGMGSVVAGSLALFVAGILGLLGLVETVSLPWGLPVGSFAVGLDALSGAFLLPLSVLSAVSAVFGLGYLRGGHGGGPHWLFLNLLAASMALVVAARDAVLLLLAWEAMSLSSFFLVVHEDEEPGVREAGWIYLVATHAGTACLLALFALLGRAQGSFAFEAFQNLALPAALAGTCFVLALAGFGTKAGLVPLHVWLPEAHPAAPSHVSALMSGAMLKVGIYGIARISTFFVSIPAWWGWLLVAVGAASGVLGILFALAQRDLKRLLAYSSVENIGIIAMALGLGLVGRSQGSATLAVMGFAAALLHVVGHAALKGQLFLAAGSILRAAGTRELDRLGGILRRMPATGAAFALGAAGLSGLPPFAAFPGELLLFVALFTAGITLPSGPAAGALSAAAVLALTSGLAAAGFVRALGIGLLGEPRTPEADAARETPGLPGPLLALAAISLALGLGAPFVLHAFQGAVRLLAATPAANFDPAAAEVRSLLASAATGAGLFATLTAAFLGLRRWLLSGRSVRQGSTWDCGYAAPTARMQYTASSFSQPLGALFTHVLRTRRKYAGETGLFPEKTALSTRTPDAIQELVYQPAFGGLRHWLDRLRWVQHGRIQFYVLYIALTLFVLLAWSL